MIVDLPALIEVGLEEKHKITILDDESEVGTRHLYLSAAVVIHYDYAERLNAPGRQA
jgi:hypothetical protein